MNRAHFSLVALLSFGAFVLLTGCGGTPTPKPEADKGPHLMNESDEDVLNTSNFSPSPGSGAKSASPSSTNITQPAARDAAPQCVAPPEFVIGVDRPTRPSRSMPLAFSAYPQFVTAGQATRLSWTAGMAKSVTLFQKDLTSGVQSTIGEFAPSASILVSPRSNILYTAQANGDGETPTDAAPVWVNVPPGTLNASFAASPQTAIAGGSATLIWNSANALSVTIDNGIGQVPLSGSMKIEPSATTTYTLTATCGTFTVQKTATITQAPRPTGIDNVKHIIFMMQENRSFDHYFGK